MHNNRRIFYVYIYNIYIHIHIHVCMCMYIHMYVYTNLVFAATRLLIQLCPPQDNLDSWVDLHIRGPREFFHLHSQSWGHVHNGEVACTFLHVEVYGINVILCLCLMFDTINLCAVPFKQDVRNWRSYCVPHNSGLTFIKVEEHTEEKRKWPHFSRFCRIASPCFFSNMHALTDAESPTSDCWEYDINILFSGNSSHSSHHVLFQTSHCTMHHALIDVPFGRHWPAFWLSKLWFWFN
jgi:hypothetical protein